MLVTNMTTKLKKFFLVFVTVALGVMSSGAAATYTATVDGTSYDFTYFTGTYNDNSALLQSQPWWGSQSSATTFATAVGGNLGFPNTEYGSWSPYFAFARLSFDSDIFINSSFYISTGSSDCCASPRDNQSISYAVATPTGGAVPEIDGSLIPPSGFPAGGFVPDVWS